MFSVLVIRLRSLRLLRVSGIVMRLRMFLLLTTFLKRSEERFSRNAETDLVCRLLLEKKKVGAESIGDIVIIVLRPIIVYVMFSRTCALGYGNSQFPIS